MGTVKSKQTCSERQGEIGGNRKKFSVTKRLSLKSAKQEYNVETTNSYIVRYVGKTARKNPGGEGIDACLRDMYCKVRKRLNELPRVCLTITPRDVAMRQISATGADNNETLIPISRISFVVADKKHQLFAFNDFISQRPRKVECHVFICSGDGESSDTIATALQGAFGAVYSEYSRKMSRRSSEQENMSYSEKNREERL